MSIKLYEGMIGTSSDPFQVADAIRGVLEPIFYKKFFGYVDEASTLETKEEFEERFYIPDNIEKVNVWGESGYKSHTLDIVWGYVNALSRSNSRTFSELDFSYNVSIIPNKTEGNPLVLIFSEYNYYTDLINSGVVEEFGYWNNSDPGGDITESEWEARERAWGYLIEDDKSPSECGLQFSSPGRMTILMENWRTRVDV